MIKVAFIDTTPAHAADGDVRAMYERQQASFGYVPNYAKVFCHRPEVMTHWANLLSGIRRNLDKRRFELVTFSAAHALRNSSCSLAHGRALTEFYSADEVLEIASQHTPGPLSAAETAMVAFARKVASDASAVTADDVAALTAYGFADHEIFDIAATTAARAFFTKVLDALGVEPDAPFLAIDGALRRALTVGRPIGLREPERIGAPCPQPTSAGRV